MATNTGLMASTIIAASFGLALAVAGASFFDGGHATSLAHNAAPVIYQELTAQIRTDWLVPASARRSLEQRNQALDRWVTARRGSIQVVDTVSHLRTRDALGERLARPAARFEQTLLIRVPSEHAPEAIAQALEGLDVTVAAVDTVPTHARTRIDF
jgi:hypothetical protein